MTPTIRLIEKTEYCKTYRVEGTPTCPEWLASLRGRPPYSEFTVYNGNDHLTSYGGEVWPTAWPELFEPIQACAQYGSAGVRITEAGLLKLAYADAAADRCPICASSNCKAPNCGERA